MQSMFVFMFYFLCHLSFIKLNKLNTQSKNTVSPVLIKKFSKHSKQQSWSSWFLCVVVSESRLVLISLMKTMMMYSSIPFFQLPRQDNEEMAPSSCYSDCNDYQHALLLRGDEIMKLLFALNAAVLFSVSSMHGRYVLALCIQYVL